MSLHVQLEALTTVEEHRHRRQTEDSGFHLYDLGHVPSLPVLDFLIADLEMISKRNTLLTG